VKDSRNCGTDEIGTCRREAAAKNKNFGLRAASEPTLDEILVPYGREAAIKNENLGCGLHGSPR
jgi:hypothetical protein